MPRLPKKPNQAWDDQKERIRTLYIAEGKTLPELKGIMEAEYQFSASKKEYVKRLQSWNMWKYSKTKERMLAREAELAPRRAGILVGLPENNLGRLGNFAEQEYLRINNSLRSLLSHSPHSRLHKSPRRMIQSTVDIIMDNIPWFQFEECFRKQVPWMRKRLILSFDWDPYSNCLFGGSSAGQVSMQHTRHILKHILGRAHTPEDSVEDISLLKRLDEILPYKPGCGHSRGSNEPFLMLVQSCIYLSSNGLLRSMEMDKFLDYVLSYGFAPFFNEMVDYLTKLHFLALDVFLSQLLLSAASLKKTDVILALLEKGVDPNGGTRDDCFDMESHPEDIMRMDRSYELSALQISILGEDIQSVLVLLNHGANANAHTGHVPFRPLELAITGQMESHFLAEALIFAGAKIDHPCHIGLVPKSFLACSDGSPVLVPYKAGNIFTKASVAQDMESMKLLLRLRDSCSNTTLSLEPALCLSVRNDDMEMVDLLLQHGASVNIGWDELETPLFLYIYEELWRFMYNTTGEWEPIEIPWQAMTPIRVAARQNNTNLAERLLDLGADVNFKPSLEMVSRVFRKVYDLCKGYRSVEKRFAEYELWVIRRCGLLATPLHESSKNGNLEMTELLLQAGAVVDCVDSVGTTPLQLACGLSELPFDKDRDTSRDAISQIRMRLVKMLLKWGANVCLAAGTWKGRTALQAAAEQGDEALIQLIIGAGADVNAAQSPKYGKTALRAAIEAGRLSIADVLVQNGAQYTIEDHCGVLNVAAGQGDTNYVEQLLAQWADQNLSNQPAWIQATGTALNSAIKSKHIDVVGKLLDGGVNVNMVLNGETALCTAVREKNHDIFELLLSYGADPDPPDCEITPLAVAAGSGCVSMMRSILLLNPDINRVSKWHKCYEHRRTGGEFTVLQWAAHAYYDQNAKFDWRPQMALIIEILLVNGADANGSMDSVPLIDAYRNGDISMFKLLLKHGADINARGYRGTSPIEAAALKGDREIVRTLLNLGADISGPVLCPALKRGDEAIVQMLLDAGARVNAVDKNGRSGVFTAAAKGGDIRILQLLLDHDADISLDPEALLHAILGGHFNMARILIERGADVNWVGHDIFEGKMALFVAARLGRLDIASLLLENDKQLDTIEERCREAAGEADYHHHYALAKYLRQYKRLQRE